MGSLTGRYSFRLRAAGPVADQVLTETALGFAAEPARVRRGRGGILLALILLTAAAWMISAGVLQVRVEHARERELALTRAGEQLHALDGVGWRASLGTIDEQAAIAEATRRWDAMRRGIERGGSPGLARVLAQTEAAVAREMASTDGQGMLGAASKPVADRLSALDGAIESARGDAIKDSVSARGVARLHAIGGGVFALTIVIVLALAYRRTVRSAGALGLRAARAEGEREALAHSQRRVHALIEHASDCVVVVAADGTVTYATDSLEALVGHTPLEAVGEPIDAVLAPADRERLGQLLAGADGVHGTISTAATLCHRDGTLVEADVRIVDRREDPDVLGLVITVRDTRERLRLERELRATEIRDRGTGLANHARLLEWIDEALQARRDDPALALVVLDLNDFHAVNESLGHAAGDECLAECARRLGVAADVHGRVARLAGDAFALLLEGLTDPDDARRAARALLDSLAAPVVLTQAEIPLSASAGIALAAAGGSAQELVRAAVTAAGAAGRRGPGHIELFAPAMHARARRRLELRSALARAIDLDELTIAYQPIVNVETGETAALEALLRWQLDGRPVSPADFIPVAEASGLMPALGARVLERACAEVVDHAAPGQPPPTVSVNVSAVQLRSPDFAATVEHALTQSGLDPRSLVLELTESTMLEHTTGVRATVDALRSLGVRIAIDDFGTGWSSLATLASLPIDVLKLDRSFVAAMDDSPAHASLVSGVLSMAERLSLPTVIEGVETQRQLDRLKLFGARYVQGYHLGRPAALSTPRAPVGAHTV